MSLIVAILLSLAFVPLVRWLSFRVGKVAVPRKDRWHRQATPTLGGVGMLLAGALTVVIFALGYPDTVKGLEERWSLLVGAGMMFALGLFDDFRRIKPPTKLVGQLLAATVVIFFGDNTINFFPWPVANILLTFFWLVGITNAINLLDNMDGLAGGVALVAAGVLSYFFWRGGNDTLLLLSLSLAGAILGFLVFNFPPARIFMGDSGSMLLGFSLAALAIARRAQASNVFAVIGVPTLLFLLPILDTTMVTITRLMRGQSPAQGGTDHTSHRLIAFGLSERQAVLVLYGVALISGVASAALEALDYDLSLVLVPLVLIGLSLFAGYLARLKVVSASNGAPGTLGRLVSNLTYKRRMFEIGLDLLLIGVSYYLAFWTRYGLNMTEESMALFLRSWPFAMGTAYLAFYLLGVYRGVWRYVGFNDLLRYGGAALLAGLLAFLAERLLYPRDLFRGDIFLLYVIFLLLGLAASRASFQVLDRLYNLQRGRKGLANVLLWGADDAGELALRWMLRDAELGYRPVGILDADPYTWGRSIHGVSVIGGMERLEEMLKDRQVEGVIVASGGFLESEPGMRLVAACRQHKVWVRRLRLAFEAVEEG
ncbi:MAG: hypothetical protein JW726_08165 [Anaerolineales bacterium]|nr:hypothetical protein [Anaerolineales bacterium]